MNKDERLVYQRARRKLTGNADIKKYEKTKKGFLVRKYRNMLSRIVGIQKVKFHLYTDKELLDKETFYEWSLASLDFNTLFDTWELNKYCRKLTPSVDRIDSSKGYTLDNMEWITHSENSRRGGLYSERHFNNS